MKLISSRLSHLPLLLLMLAFVAGCTFPNSLPVVVHAVAAAGPTADRSAAQPAAAETGVPLAIVMTPGSEPVATTTPPAATETVTVTPTATAAATTPPVATPDLASPSLDSAAVAPFATPTGLERTVRVPILMYHYISQPGADADVYRKDLSVPPDRFESHLAYLRDNGFHVITLDDLRDAMLQGKTLPDKPVVLTFDDGYEDNYTNAFPLLKKYSMTAYFFVLTDVTTEGRTGYMTWPQLAEMAAAGEHIGAHGRNHLQAFRGKSRDFLNWHALGTAEAIQQHLGYHPRWVAYPTGAYDDLTMEVFHSAGFVGGLSTEPGATHRPDTLFHLSRVRVHGNYSAEELGRVLKAS